MLAQGLRTVIYEVPDLTKAKAWYSVAFEVLPYFDESYYVGFTIDGYELGLVPGEEAEVKASRSVMAYWGVTNADAAFKNLIEKGAQEHEAVHQVGGEIYVGSVYDPFGNIIGIIENPHFQAGS